MPPDKEAVPSTVVPAMKVTVPVGVEPEAALTVAEIATDWPSTELAGAVSVLVVVMG